MVCNDFQATGKIVSGHGGIPSCLTSLEGYKHPGEMLTRDGNLGIYFFQIWKFSHLRRCQLTVSEATPANRHYSFDSRTDYDNKMYD